MTDQEGLQPPGTARTFRSALCGSLTALCADPHVEWAYHPRSGIGRLVIDKFWHSLESLSAELTKRCDAGKLVLESPARVGGKRRQKKIDLLATVKGTQEHLVAVEAKACMTAHAKARPRLVDELTSSLDAVIEADANAQCFGIVVVNFGGSFLSPLNLPGPNNHEPDDGPKLVAALRTNLSRNQDIANTLIVPVLFDNETSCRPTADPEGVYLAEEHAFMVRVLRALGVTPEAAVTRKL
jgi:hypothetical protein